MSRIGFWLTAVTCAAVTSVVSPRAAAACSCAGFPSPCEAFAAAERVFVGEVTSVQQVGHEHRHRLQVIRTVKGTPAETADVWSDAFSSCGLRLTEGHRYVIYTSATGRIEVGGCSPIVHLPPGEPEPELPPVPGRIYGRVARYDQPMFRPANRFDPVASVRLWVDLPSGRVTATTDAWGRFTFVNVPPGTYTMGTDSGQGVRPWLHEHVTLPSPSACIEVPVLLYPSGELSGRVITADGRPASRIYLQLFDAQDTGDAAESSVDGATTDAEGRFNIERLPAGEYLLAVNPLGIEGRQPYPARFFGGPDRASATRISVGEGVPTVLDRPFALAPARATRTFTFAVSCRDGSTPPFTHAEARSLAEPGVVEHDIDAGTPPVQTLTLLRDLAYSLLVTASVPYGAPGPNGRERRGQPLPPIDIPAGTPGRHIALTAPFANCGDGR